MGTGHAGAVMGTGSILQVLRESVVMRGVRHVVVDNLQFLVGCQDTATERWQQQDRAMAAFRSFATQQQCHVTLIVHPKKVRSTDTPVRAQLATNE